MAVQNVQEQKKHIKNFIRQQLPFFKIANSGQILYFLIVKKAIDSEI